MHRYINMQPTQPSPPSVLLYAPTSPRSASAWLRETLQQYVAQHAEVGIVHISPLLQCTPRLLYAHVLRELRDDGEACSDAGTFVQRLSVLASRLAKMVLVVHEAERTRDLWPEHVWEMWPILAEMTRQPGQVMVVYVSSLPWSFYRSISGRTISVTPLLLPWMGLGRNDMLELLASDASLALRDAPADVNMTLYQNVCGVMYDTMKQVVSDEYEMRLLCASVWKALMAIVRKGAKPGLHDLMPHVSECCRDALARIVPRTVGPSAWVEHRTSPASLPSSHTPPLPPRTGYGATQAFLLIAAYIASYNPSKTDAKHFVRELGASRKRRRTKAQKAADAALLETEGKKEMWDRTKYWGPHSFSLERLLAIYQALLVDFKQDLNEDGLPASMERSVRTAHNKAEQHWEYVAGEFWSRSSTTLAELNELVRQQLIVRVSPANKLSAMQYRVNASFEYVRQVAHTVGFPLNVWLWDAYI